MKYARMIGLLAVAASALMAFVGTASATLTSPTGTVLKQGDYIHVKSEGHVALDPASLPAIECESTVIGHPSKDGGTIGQITELNFAPCTNDWHMTTVTAGELEIVADGVADTYDGVIYSKGATIETTRFGITCRLATKETTKVGSFTGGNPGTIHLEANIPFHSGSFLCGSGLSTWEGSYRTTEALYVDG